MHVINRTTRVAATLSHRSHFKSTLRGISPLCPAGDVSRRVHRFGQLALPGRLLMSRFVPICGGPATRPGSNVLSPATGGDL
jgi:hypothetical protein